MTTTAPGLAARAVHTARGHRTADPHGYRRRHGDPDQWIGAPTTTATLADPRAELATC